MEKLIQEIRACTLCKNFLPDKPRPIIQASKQSRIVIIGQSPGQKVHASGVPWADASGNELRRWLGVNSEEFYNDELFALMPMGFCYPGKGKSGDLPPREECAPQWHSRLLREMKNVKLILLIGRYAQEYYLHEKAKATLTETVELFTEFLPSYFPLVHPSPRNRIWQKKNLWFEKRLLPALQSHIHALICR